MHNTVNESNFNQTATGYLKRALRDCYDLSDEQKEQVLRNFYWTFDYMTMGEARRFYANIKITK